MPPSSNPQVKLPETPREAIKLCLEVHDKARALERQENMKIFDEPEMGFLSALKTLGFVVVPDESS